MLRRFGFSAAILAALVSGAVAQGTTKPKATMNAEVTQQLPDNTSGVLAPSNARTVFNDIIASTQQAPQVNSQTGLSYAFLAADYGNLVTFSNASAIAVTLPQATTLNPWNVYVLNKGAGIVTITPQGGSTINGAAQFSLLTGGSVQIVSDGTNFQVFGVIGSGVTAGLHVTKSLGAAPTANSCAGFLLNTNGTDVAGSISFNSATTCTISFGTPWSAAPFCVVSPGSAASTVLVTTTTLGMSVTFGTANTALAWICQGA